jgi:hypothetical protein
MYWREKIILKEKLYPISLPHPQTNYLPISGALNWDFIFIFSIFSVGSTRVCTQGLVFARQMVYHLSHSSSCHFYFNRKWFSSLYGWGIIKSVVGKIKTEKAWEAEQEIFIPNNDHYLICAVLFRYVNCYMQPPDWSVFTQTLILNVEISGMQISLCFACNSIESQHFLFYKYYYSILSYTRPN